MRRLTRIISLVTVLFSVGLPTVVAGTASAVPPPGCTIERKPRPLDQGRELTLEKCPSDHPGYRYRAKLTGDGRYTPGLGDYVRIYYYPQYNGRTPDIGRWWNGEKELVSNWFYGMPGELQACARINGADEYYCVW